MSEIDSKLTKIGVFYDGNYFFHVSNYYTYSHPRKARLSISGLHEFICGKVAQVEDIEPRYCHIVDAHYFRGRLAAHEANARQKLLQERIFDDVLMREGVVTHYLPIVRQGEKGIDVWFALEAFELAIFKRFNVLVLIACDGDFIPLVRKVNALGTRVMVLGWDFQYVDESGAARTTKTSINLLKEATYPVHMHNVIDGDVNQDDPLVSSLFVHPREATQLEAHQTLAESSPTQPTQHGQIISLKEGYGFVSNESLRKNLFFFWADLLDCDFNSLKTGDRVSYSLGKNEKGECAKDIHKD